MMPTILVTAPLMLAGEDAAPFKVRVIDSDSGRGVPAVELETVAHVRYYTDSSGAAAGSPQQ